MDSTLKDIRTLITEHSSNAWAKKLGYKPVYSASETSRIVIIGQAPGKKAQESGIPWNDVSGDTLRKWFDLSKEEFYDGSKIALIPMDFYFPGKDNHGDKPPRKEFAPQWHPQLLKLMPHVQLTVLVGQYAQKYYLRQRMKKNLTETVRAYDDYLPDFLPLIHPSPLNMRWRSKNPWFEEQVVPEVRKLIHECLQTADNSPKREKAL